LFVVHGSVTHAPGFFPETVFRANTRVVEAGRDGVHVARLAVVVLEDVAVAAVQYAGGAETQGRGVLAAVRAAAAGLDADQRDRRIVGERGEDARGVGPAADAGDHRVRQPADLFQALGLRFATDDRLETAD